MAEHISTPVRLSITDLSPDGRGVGRVEHGQAKDLVVFVAGALPGQRVLAQIETQKARFATAHVYAIEDEMGLRQPLCAAATVCGGCPLQRLPRADQHTWKTKILANVLTRLGHVSDTCLQPMRAAEAEIHFRNKIEYAFGCDENDPGHIVVGFRKKDSHAVVLPRGCILMSPEVAHVRSFVEEQVNRSGLPPYTGRQGFWRHLTIRESRGGLWLIVLTSGPHTAVKTLAEAVLAEFPHVAGIVHETRRARDMLLVGERRELCVRQKGATDYLELPLGGQTFFLDPTSFFQVHLAAAELLAESALQQITSLTAGRGEHLLDLYCGVGAPGLLAAPKFTSIQGLELSNLSARYAKINAARFGCTNYAVTSGNCAAKISSLIDRLTLDRLTQRMVVLVDPPRTGLDTTSKTLLTRNICAGIVYISCNPTTLARDLADLSTAYTVQTIVPVDIFPHTAHVETCTLLYPKKHPPKKASAQKSTDYERAPRSSATRP